jgi:hypothetical protein
MRESALARESIVYVSSWKSESALESGCLPGKKRSSSII